MNLLLKMLQATFIELDVVSSIVEDQNTIIILTVHDDSEKCQFRNLSTTLKFAYGKDCQVLILHHLLQNYQLMILSLTILHLIQC